MAHTHRDHNTCIAIFFPYILSSLRFNPMTLPSLEYDRSYHQIGIERGSSVSFFLSQELPNRTM